MQVFKVFFQIAWKMRVSLIIYMIAYLIINIIITKSVSQDQNTVSLSFQQTKCKVALIQLEESDLGTAFSSYLSAKHTLVDIPYQKEALQDALFYRNVDYIIVIPKGFSESFYTNQGMQLETLKVADSYTAKLLDMEVNKWYQMLQMYLRQNLSFSAAVEKTNHLLQQEIRILVEEENQSQSQHPAYFYFKYLSYVLMSMLFVVIGSVFILFYQKDIQQRHICSALKLRSKNMQLSSACLLFSFCIWLIFVLIAFLLFGNGLSIASYTLFLLNSFVFLLFILSFSFLLGLLAKTVPAISAMSTAITLSLCFLGGIFVPIELMSEPVLKFTRFLPTYWFTKVNDYANNLGTFSFEDGKWALYGLVIQLGFAIAIFTIGLVVSKQKQITQ